MRVTLTQDELFEAISSHLKDKLNLDDTATIEISFTAGRSPRGYTADVDITYPKSALASKFTAKAHDDSDSSLLDTQVVITETTSVEASTNTAVPATLLFG